MKRRLFILLAMGLTSLVARAENDDVKDPGGEVIAQVAVTVYYGTDGDAAKAGPRTTDVPAETVKKLSADPKLHFAKYRQLGKDVQPLYRSFQNWAKPLGKSEEILLRFEAQGALSKDVIRMDTEVWVGRKKILKTDAPLSMSRPLLVLGPEWRGGRLILAIELAPVASKP